MDKEKAKCGDKPDRRILDGDFVDGVDSVKIMEEVLDLNVKFEKPQPTLRRSRRSSAATSREIADAEEDSQMSIGMVDEDSRIERTEETAALPVLHDSSSSIDEAKQVKEVDLLSSEDQGKDQQQESELESAFVASSASVAVEPVLLVEEEEAKGEKEEVVVVVADVMERPLPGAGGNRSFDLMEIPLTGAGTSMSGLSEFETAPGDIFSDVAQIVDDRPLVVRIVDNKSWKVRLQAYSDLKTSLESNPDEVDLCAIIPLIPTMVGDSNAAAADSALDVATLLLECSDTANSSHTDLIQSNAVSITNAIRVKAFPAKQSTQNKGKALLLKLMEVSSTDVISTVVEGLLKALDGKEKKVKIPPMCIDTIKEACVSFGVSVLPLKLILGSLSIPLTDGKLAPNRESSMALCIEIYRWIGAAPLNSLTNTHMKASQKAEFEKQTEGIVVGVCVPSVYSRATRPEKSQMDKAKMKADAAVTSSSAASVSNGVTSSANGSSINPREFMEAIDLSSRLSSKQCEYKALIKSEGWADQLRALNIVIDTIGTIPYLKAGTDLTDLFATLKTICRNASAHIQLTLAAMKICTMLCEGLSGEKEIAPYIRPLLKEIISKAKDKKVCPDISACVSTCIAHTVSFDHVMESITETLKNKKFPVHGRLVLLDLIRTCLSMHTHRIGLDAGKSLAECICFCVDDSDPKMREAAVQCLSMMWAVYNNTHNKPTSVFFHTGPTVSSAMGSSICHDGLKVLKMLEISNNKVYKKMIIPPSEALSASTKATASAMVTEKEKEKDSIRSTRKPSANPSSSTFSTNTANATATANNVTTVDDVDPDVSLSLEDCVSVLSTLGIDDWEDACQLAMGGDKWQEKCDILDKIADAISKNVSKAGQISTHIVAYIRTHTNGFKNSNMNILKSVCKCITVTAEAAGTGSDTFSQPAASIVIKAFAPMLADKKVSGCICDMFIALMEVCTPTFVIKRMAMALGSHLHNFTGASIKAPSAHQISLELIQKCVVEFGVGSMPISTILHMCVYACMNKVSALRAAGLKMCSCLFEYIGPRVKGVATSVFAGAEAGVISLIETEWGKCSYNSATLPNPTRTCKSAGSTTGGTSQVKKGGAVASIQDSQMEGISRCDLETMLPKNIFQQLDFTEGKTSWQNRKTALEAIVDACDKSGMFIEGTDTSSDNHSSSNKYVLEIARALRTRIQKDTHIALKPIAVTALGKVIASVQDGVSTKLLRICGQGLCAGLTENKKSMRDSTLTALFIAITKGKYDPLAAPASAPALVEASLLSALIPALSETLTNPVARVDLLEWICSLSETFTGHKMDCNELVTPLVLCLQDKGASVRSMAENLLVQFAQGFCITHNDTATESSAGVCVTRPTWEKATRDLPPAVIRGLCSTFDKISSAFNCSVGAECAPSQKEREIMSSTSCVKSSESGTVHRDSMSPACNPRLSTNSHSNSHSKDVPATSKIASLGSLSLPAPPTSLPTMNIKREHDKEKEKEKEKDILRASEASNTIAPVSMFRKTSKAKRLEEFHKLNWPVPPAEPSSGEWSILQTTWTPLLSSDLASLLFPDHAKASASSGISQSMDSIVPALDILQQAMVAQRSTFFQHADLLLRWCGCVLCYRETPTGLFRLLTFIDSLFTVLHSYQDENSGTSILHDCEITSLIPILIEKSGHKSERHRTAFKSCISICTNVGITCEIPLVTTTRMCNLLISGLGCKNKKTRVVCLEEMGRMVDIVLLSGDTSASSAFAMIGRSGLREIGAFVDSKDNDVAGRSATLDLCWMLYRCTSPSSMGAIDAIAFAKLTKALGSISERAQCMVEDRIKQKIKIFVDNPQGSTTSISESNRGSITSVTVSIDTPTHSHAGRDSIKSVVSVSPEYDPFQLQMTPPGTGLKWGLGNKTGGHVAMGSRAHTHTKSQRFASEAGAPPTPILWDETGDNMMFNTKNMDRRASMDPSTIAASHVRKALGDDMDRYSNTAKTPEIDRASVRTHAPFESVEEESSYIVSGAVSLTPEALSYSQQIAPTESIFSDITMTIRNFVTSFSSSDSVSDKTSTCYANARESLKILHKLLSDSASEAYATHMSLFSLQADECLDLVVQCFDAAFNDTLDVSLASVCLAVIFSAIRAQGGAVVQSLSETSCENLFDVCLRRITYPSLQSSTSSDADRVADGEQVLKAINLVLLNLASAINGYKCISALLKVLKKCVPLTDGICVAIGYQGVSKPASRLVMKILPSLAHTGVHSDRESLQSILFSLHLFFDGHPPQTTDDLPFCTAKTVLDSLIGVTMGGVVSVVAELANMHKHSKSSSNLGTKFLPSDSFVVRLACRIGGISVPNWVGKDTAIADDEPDENRNTIHNKQDKLKVKHSDIFEFEQLKLQMPTMSATLPVSARKSRSSIATSTPSRNLVSKSLNQLDGSSRKFTASPRVAMTDKVLFDLNSLTTALDLPTRPARNSLSGMSSSTSISSSTDGDSDLASRLARLRTLGGR